MDTEDYQTPDHKQGRGMPTGAFGSEAVITGDPRKQQKLRSASIGTDHESFALAMAPIISGLSNTNFMKNLGPTFERYQNYVEQPAGPPPEDTNMLEEVVAKEDDGSEMEMEISPKKRLITEAKELDLDSGFVKLGLDHAGSETLNHLLDELPKSDGTENEDNEGDGEGREEEMASTEFLPLDETRLLEVAARFKGRQRITPGLYKTLVGEKSRRSPEPTTFSFDLLLYRRTADPDNSKRYVRVKKDLYMTLDNLKRRLVPDGGATEADQDKKLLDIYQRDWIMRDLKEGDSERVHGRGAKRVSDTEDDTLRGLALLGSDGSPFTRDPASGMVSASPRKIVIPTDPDYFTKPPPKRASVAFVEEIKKPDVLTTEEEGEDLRRAWGQFQQWIKIAEYACLPIRAKYDPSTRYWDSNLRRTGYSPTLKLFLECSGSVSKTQLAALARVALRHCDLRPVITIIDPGESEKQGYHLVGAHLLNFYRTYTTADGIDILRQFGRHKGFRQFPSPLGVRKVSTLMTVKPPTLSNTETHTKISVAHLNSYLRRERQKSQQQLMKISATVLAREFGWEPNPPKEKADLPTEVQPEPINDSTQGLKFSQPLESPKSSDWSNQAEWLHRSAHSYGTLSFNDPAEQYGPQEKANIIFGTKEANTFMMRPEASVKNIARMQSYRISDAIEGAKFGPAAFSASSSGYRYDLPPSTGVKPSAAEKAKLEQDARAFRIRVTSSVETLVKDLSSAVSEMEENEVNWPQSTEQNTSAITSSTLHEGEPAENKPIPSGKRQAYLQKYFGDKFWFLTDALVYDVRVENVQGATLNKRFVIDPFSTFLPLKFEAELDKLVETLVFASHRLPEFEACEEAKITVL